MVIKRDLVLAVLLLFNAPIIISQTYFWQRVSSPSEGVINAYAISEKTGSMFISTYATNNNMYKSTDGGATWILLDTLFNRRTPQSLVISTVLSSRGNIYVGTQKGLFCSTDDGATWRDISPDRPERDVRVVTINSKGTIFITTSDSGLYRSTDDGNNWKRLNLNQSYSGPTYFSFNSKDNLYVYQNYYGINYSTDLGDTWTVVDSTFMQKDVRFIVVDIHDHLFIAIDDTIYRSTDNGKNWLKCNGGQIMSGLWSIIAPQSGRFNGSIFISSSSGVYRSSDDGNSWTLMNKGMIGIGSGQLFIDKNDNIYFATIWEGNLFRSTDGGEYWDHIKSSIGECNIYSMSINPLNNNVFAAATTSGLFRSTDNGKTWTLHHKGLTTSNLRAVVASLTGYIFVGTESEGIFRSSDNGETWNSCSNGLPNAEVRGLAVLSNADILAGCLNYGIYLSTNNGESWSQVFYPAGLFRINSLAVGSNENVYASTSGILISNDNGRSWFESINGLVNKSVWCVAESEFGISKGHLFAGTFGSGIARSTNNGESWVPLGGNEDVRAIVVNQLGDIYAASKMRGVLRSTDDGATWKQHSEGMGAPWVTSFALTQSGYIFAGTNYSGVFRTTQSTTTVKEFNPIVETTFSIGQNYPNPFTTSTTIPLQINSPSSEFVRIKVSDVLGREMKILFEGELSSGNHEIKFDGEGLKSGQYFVKLQTKDRSSLIKVVMLK